MKFRKKHKEQSEVFTDSLNDILFILLMFFLITTTMANPNVVKVNNPRGTKDTKAKQNIVVSINKDQQFFVGQRPVESAMLDSFLIQEIRRAQLTVDTPSVVINADSIAYYGEVFRVMKLAKSAGARPLGVVK
ncbi:biopolymer transporter ExbD [Terrimonas sp. NA20]|uniref:Biopolymer transporter ExbD n=1 Tax=Terrimonas ginsenosidimutans TaxID=2908004 RepID=A0ABS9KY70_9BACT|nr:biopolymer transporter ExbD [Terrimonas ginsenosidimutans]MCG2617265.1 biopolymer transporter ExbD [Terrimonas ginsenosidimutans]